MKKLFAALFALLLTLSLAGCRNEAHIIHEEQLLPDMADSQLYRQAVKQGAIILADDRVVTGRADAENLVTGLLTEDGAELYVYRFRPERGGRAHDCVIQHFENVDGAPMVDSGIAGDWDQTPALSEPLPADDLRLSRYGYLTYYDAAAAEQTGVQVVNDSDLFAGAEENAALAEKYLAPIFYTAIGRSEEWSSQKEAGDAIWLAEDICHYQGGSFAELYPDGEIPVNDLVALLAPYFDGVDRATFLHAGYDYDPAGDTIHYAGGRGGVPFRYRVTTSSQEGNMLRIAYHLYSHATGEPLEGTSFVLTVQLQEDGSFRYMSNLMA